MPDGEVASGWNWVETTMGAIWGRAQQRSAQAKGPPSRLKLGSWLGLLSDTPRAGLGGTALLPTLGAAGGRAACGRPQIRAAHPQLFPRGSQALSDGGSGPAYSLARGRNRAKERQ